MADATGKGRLQISLTQEILDRILTDAKKLGVSPSAFMQMTMNQHYEMQDRMAQFKGLPEVMDRLEKLAKEQKNG